MSYTITQYTKDRAKELNVVVKPSKKKNKKIDVFKDDKLIVSVGDKRYKDFPTFTKEKGLEFAKERQRLYRIRHKFNTGVAGKFASKLLW